MVLIVFLKWVLDVKGFTNLTRALQILELPDKLQYKFWIRAESVRPGSFWWSVCSKPQEMLWNSKVGVGSVGEKLGRWGQDCWGSGVSARVSHLCWAWAEAPAPLGLEVTGKITCYFSLLTSDWFTTFREGRTDIRKEDHRWKTSNIPIVGFFLG